MLRSGKDFHINFQWLAGKFKSSVSLIMSAGIAIHPWNDEARAAERKTARVRMSV